MTDDLVKRLRKGVMCGDDPIVDEAADRIEKLEAAIVTYSSAVAGVQVCNEELNRALNRVIDRWEIQSVRIEKLEAALRHYVCDCIAPDCEVGAHGDAICGIVARKALERKDD
jgi:exonuclease VII small subunit